MTQFKKELAGLNKVKKVSTGDINNLNMAQTRQSLLFNLKYGILNKMRQSLSNKENSSIDKDWLTQVNKMPILGIPLINYSKIDSSRDKVTGHELGMQLWGEVADNIFQPTRSQKVDPLKQLIMQYYINQENDDYVKKGFSFGVKIRDHGNCP